MTKDIIKFIRQKDYKFVKSIGQGGTGKTVLLKDEIIDEVFVCKKYSPFYKEQKESLFKYFVEEIKILYKLYHRNIVRVFNYYLYDDKTTGYILMEYINGIDIASFTESNPHLISSLFVQAISGFKYLEENKILHRDIRNQNILVTEDCELKIIDFGFGKIIDFEGDFDKSISLNWPYSPPKEFNNKLYDHRTEVYFVGKLFEEIINNNKVDDFPYMGILKNMIEVDFEKRISSFALVERQILTNNSIGVEFSTEDKNTYRHFADNLIKSFSKIRSDAPYKTNIDKIIEELEGTYRNSILEEYIQKPNVIAHCFVGGEYYYHKKAKIPVSSLNDFITFYKSISIEKKKIVLNNLWQRLDTIERYEPQNVYDNLPF